VVITKFLMSSSAIPVSSESVVLRLALSAAVGSLEAVREKLIATVVVVTEVGSGEGAEGVGVGKGEGRGVGK